MRHQVASGQDVRDLRNSALHTVPLGSPVLRSGLGPHVDSALQQGVRVGSALDHARTGVQGAAASTVQGAAARQAQANGTSRTLAP